MTAFDFLRWCFSDEDHALGTLVSAWMLFEGVKGVVRACRGEE